ncbi:MAG TPA: DNA topoisomerase IV subunit A [Kofleriaceae bacterium]|nr:DNA topoisomerase IV subunit A [Kofleriaceae bacterium]
MSQGKEDQLELFRSPELEESSEIMARKQSRRTQEATAKEKRRPAPRAGAAASAPGAQEPSAPSRRRSRGGGGKKPPGGGAPAGGGGGGVELDASLMQEARRRYLTYALSVITARALPDVRDGLKPVQRRILYAMSADEHLYPDAKHRKSAKVVGAVIGRYHPHGDSAVYDAMVRMAQDFSLRLPLVDGSGNFGSLDGDGAAAYRYTECRLAPPAMELLRELKQDTVAMRPNYDGTAEEPVVLPARFPNLLVNGSTGIAVGMATNIPPHNLGEVVKACIALIEDRDLTTTNLLKHIQGPDFPTGGQILNSKVELRQIYEAGQGAIRVRGEYKVEPKKRGGEDIVITSIPYGVTKATVVERIAEVIIKRQVPQLVDVRDESTDDVRIVLEVKKDTDPAIVMAYLYKHTPLQLNFNVNFTCLIPTPGADVGQPERLGIKQLLEHFIDFRFEVTRKRFEFELAALKRRIHILEGFAVIFDALDETIKIIRKSDGKQDAAGKLMKRFDLDEVQVEAILELKLYKLARLEILVIREELAEKKKEARRIEAILASKAKLWGVVKGELSEVAYEHASPRRTRTGGAAEEVEFDAEAYIVEEDAHVVVSRDGWIKRVRELKDPKSTRLREGDEVMAVLAGSTRENVVFFTNHGSAYVLRINDVPPSTGYGDPAQKLFKFKDQERIVAAYSLDPRVMLPGTMLAVSARGFGLRFDLEPHRQVSTRAGRKYARPSQGDEIVAVLPVSGGEAVAVATRGGHALTCAADEVNKLENPGKGVTVIKTAGEDRVIGVAVGKGKKDVLRLVTESGTRRFEVAADPRQAGPRGGKGRQLVKRSSLVAVSEPVVITPLANAPGGSEVH